MLKEMLSNRSVQGAFVFIVLVVVGSMLYSMYVEREIALDLARSEEQARRYEEILGRAPQDTAARKPNTDAVGAHPPKSDGDEWYADDSIAAPLETVGASTVDSNTATQDAATQDAAAQDATYPERMMQYREDYKAWDERHEQAIAEKNRIFDEGISLFPDIGEIGVDAYAEYLREFRSRPLAERNKFTAEVEARLEKLKAAIEKRRAILKERPVRPTPPETD